MPEAWQGQGGDGAVYRAEREGFRRVEPGALKVSLLLWNWRMEREVELLSRLNHLGIPRLLDRGGSQPPGSGEYPYFVMEWVEGPRLYRHALEDHAFDLLDPILFNRRHRGCTILVVSFCSRFIIPNMATLRVLSGASEES
jgi:serine/threonine protein kinase